MDDNDIALTPYQMIACVKRTGHTFIIKPMEQILKVDEGDKQITVFIKYVKLIERGSMFQVTETGVRMVWYTKKPDGTWDKRTVDAPDEKPDFQFVRSYGQSITPDVWNARIDWATICHRPGTDRSPLDNEMVTRDYPELTTKKMRNHWDLRSA